MARYRPKKKNSLRKRVLIWSSLLALSIGGAGTWAGTEGVEILKRDARILAASHQLPGRATNAIEHTHASARMTDMFGERVATFLGNCRESFSTKNDPADSWRDQWNNRIGRQIALHAERTGADIDDLVVDAWRSGQLIDNPRKDDRIDLGTEPDPSYLPPDHRARVDMPKQAMRPNPLLLKATMTVQVADAKDKVKTAASPSAMLAQLKADAHAFARAHDIPRGDWNAVEHAHASMSLTLWLGPQLAKAFGDAREAKYAHLRDPRDTWRDKYNNAIGRQIALHARAEGHSAEALLARAWQDGQLITKLTDKRIVLDDQPDPGYEPPKAPPLPLRKPI